MPGFITPPLPKIHNSLVCLMPQPHSSNNITGSAGGGGAKESDSSSWSVGQALTELQSYQLEDRVMRHYLEPSIRAPKRFVLQPPSPSNDDDESYSSSSSSSSPTSWPECLLKIRSVGDVCGLVGNEPGEKLAKALWGNDDERIPESCCAVVEVEIELLTGRTHQIRGQMSAAGYPLVGDAQYGGSVPYETYPPPPPTGSSGGSSSDGGYKFIPDRLALQCCELEFLDPDIVPKKDGTIAMTPSKRWNQFRLDKAWWSSLIDDFREQTLRVPSKQATTLASDIGLMGPRAVTKTSSATTAETTEVVGPAKPHLLPSRVSLSPGKNKYVLIRATHPNADKDEWFVRSASPAECGGPYHGNVAQVLHI